MLIKRVLSALVGIPLLLYFIYLGDLWYTLIVWLIVIIGMREFLAMMDFSGIFPHLVGYAGVTALLGGVYLENYPLVLMIITILFVFTALGMVFRFNEAEAQESTSLFWGIMYIGGLMSFLVLIRNSFTFEFTVILFAVVWLNDTFAYFAGNKWGRRKLIPSVSPGKTVEGSVGGFLGTVAFVVITFILMEWFYPLDFGWSIAMAILIIILAQLGDLVESALKRKMEVKDSGGLIPGHGGILDRFDSMLLAAPFVYLFLFLIV